MTPWFWKVVWNVPREYKGGVIGGWLRSLFELAMNMNTESRTINGIVFTSKKKAWEYTKKIIYSIPIGNIYKSSIYFNFFLDLIQVHPIKKYSFDEIESFEIKKKSIYYDERALCIHLVSGEIKTVSANCCAKDTFNEIYPIAFRSSIQLQINMFRKFTPIPERCPNCNISQRYYEVDHVYPFSRIMKDFLKKEGIDPRKLVFYQKDGDFQWYFEDYEIEGRWGLYHTYAELQYLCKKCNVSKSNKIIK